MGFHHLDQFAHVDSALTRRAPTARLLGTVILAVGAAILPLGAWPQLAALALLVVGFAALGRIRPGPFLARFAPPFAFVVLASAAVLVLAPGRTLVGVGPLQVTDAGLLRFGSATGRAAIGLGAAVVLVCTTPFPDMLRALRSLRLPQVVTTSLGLAYRHLYVLIDEVGRLRRAALSRNAAGGAAPRRRLLTGIAAVAIQRSVRRSERTYQAMLSRGYAEHMLSLTAPSPATPSRTGRPLLEVTGLAILVTLVVVSAAL